MHQLQLVSNLGTSGTAGSRGAGAKAPAKAGAAYAVPAKERAKPTGAVLAHLGEHPATSPRWTPAARGACRTAGVRTQAKEG